MEDIDDLARARSVLAKMAVGDVQVDVEARKLTAAVDAGADSLRMALQHLHRSKIAVVDVGLRRPTLDDVFLTLTGQATRNGTSSEEVSS